MRLLLVHPGADFSVHDVYMGLAEALTRAGHEVGTYALSVRLEIAARYLTHTLTLARRTDPTLPRRPQFADITLKASEDVVLAALRGQVDAVLIISAMYLNPQALFMLRAARIPVGIVFTESPYQDDEQEYYATLASVCWTNERTSVERLRRANARTYYLPAAYRAGVHTPGEAPPDVPRHDVLFIGSLFKERAELLAAVDWSGIDLGLYGSLDALDKRSALYRRLRPYVRGGVMDNARTIDHYRAAKIVLNPYRTSTWIDGGEHVTTGESLNPRAYEVAACGAFQIGGDRAESREVFGAGVPTFRTAADLQTLVRTFLDNDDWRDLSATIARRRIAPHTFDARAAQVVAQLGGALLSNPFITRTAPVAVAAD